MRDNINIALRAICYLLIQVLLLNHIQLFGWCGIYFYVLFILSLRNDIKPSALLLIAAAYGATLDVFSGVYGIHTAATVFVAYLRPMVMKLFVTQEQMEKGDPSLKEYGAAYYYYALTLIVVHHLTLYLLESLTFVNFGFTMLKALSSIGITALIMVLIEKIKKSRRKQ